MAQIAPAIHAADFARLGEALALIKAAGATMVHMDVMDGHFTPGLTFGQPVLASLRKATDLVLDVHLLIERPERYAEEFIELGAERLAVHAEATTQLHCLVERIRKAGAKAGVALNPATPVDSVSEILGDVDFVTLLTADPGREERNFIRGSVEKVRALADLRRERRLDFAIQAEGAIDLEQVPRLVGAGADILVAGSAIFANERPQARLAEMMRLAAETRQTSKV